MKRIWYVPNQTSKYNLNKKLGEHLDVPFGYTPVWALHQFCSSGQLKAESWAAELNFHLLKSRPNCRRTIATIQLFGNYQGVLKIKIKSELRS